MTRDDTTGEPLHELALFAGAGGGILGGHLLGWNTVCAVEIDEYARKVLLARQRDGCLPRFPIWDDVQTFDGRPWRGRIDIISGGFPCQDISAAGRGAGITGERSGLWSHMARIVGEVRPQYVFVENSPLLVSRGLDVVLADLAALGYDARWGVVGAHHAGAPHRRDRCWVVAYGGSGRHRAAQEEVCPGRDATELGSATVSDADSSLRDGGTDQSFRKEKGRTLVGGAGKAVSDADTQGLETSEQPGALRGEWDGCEAHGPTSERDSTPGPIRPCVFCGYEFDHELLGRYGCPNCEGEGIDVSDAHCAGGQTGSEYTEAREEGETNKSAHTRIHATASDADCFDGGSGPTEEYGTEACYGSWWLSEPDVGGMADGVASGLDVHGAYAGLDVGRVAVGVPDRAARLKCIGNGQVPAAMVLAWITLIGHTQQ